jgi:hypothetical protein
MAACSRSTAEAVATTTSWRSRPGRARRRVGSALTFFQLRPEAFDVGLRLPPEHRRSPRREEPPDPRDLTFGLERDQTTFPVLLDAAMRPDICATRGGSPSDVDRWFPVHHLGRYGVASTQEPRCLLAATAGFGGPGIEPLGLDDRAAPSGMFSTSPMYSKTSWACRSMCAVTRPLATTWHFRSFAPVEPMRRSSRVRRSEAPPGSG